MAGVIHRMGISEQTFYRWKKVYGGLGMGELLRVKSREDENLRSSSWLPTCAWTSFRLRYDPGDHIAVRHPAGCASKKSLTSGHRREIVAHVQASHGVSERRSCSALGVERSSVRYVRTVPTRRRL